ncbi:hypothetical protein BDQ12DRAFT_631087 [Crucibulum laeve]|uniref:F-box domain-containing protein n=1 Tax=Crucibulum laeve TaxID=68775 RepID=A0A5C3M0I6_9AGAR|nr:hypothetical protein BDQ12DRAFT_631087 [Crucibulum laeve]
MELRVQALPTAPDSNRPVSNSSPLNVCDQRRKIREEMSHIIERLNFLQTKYNDLSPAARLPHEIWAEIFQCYLPEPMSALFFSSDHLNPFIFGKICNLWRQIAWYTPALWASVHLRLSRRSYIHQQALLEEWILRSASYPLSVYLTYADEEIDWWENHPPQEILQVLSRYSDRWLNVDLILPPSCYWAVGSIHGRLPILQKVAIRSFKDGQSGTPLDMFAIAPQLREVTLPWTWFSELVFPWSQLHFFEVRAFSPDEALAALNSTSNLTRCKFTNLLNHEISPGAQDIVLPHLACFELVAARETNLSPLFDILSTPALKEIYLTASKGNLLTLASLCIRSLCDLQKLSVSEMMLKEDELIQALHDMKSIREIVFSNVDIVGSHPEIIQHGLSNHFVNVLHPKRHEMISSALLLLPNLEIFAYSGDCIRFHDRAIVDMLACRWKYAGKCLPTRAFSRLRSFYLKVRLNHHGFHITPRREKKLLDLIEGGMDINIEVSGYRLPQF